MPRCEDSSSTNAPPHWQAARGGTGVNSINPDRFGPFREGIPSPALDNHWMLTTRKKEPLPAESTEAALYLVFACAVQALNWTISPTVTVSISFCGLFIAALLIMLCFVPVCLSTACFIFLLVTLICFIITENSVHRWFSAEWPEYPWFHKFYIRASVGNDTAARVCWQWENIQLPINKKTCTSTSFWS